MVSALHRRSVLAGAAALCLGWPVRAQGRVQDSAPVIAAASDLHFVLKEIAAAFAADTGMTVRLSFGATGNLARQIRAGAPFEIFLAADDSFVAGLQADGLTLGAGDLYGIGRIVMVARKGAALTPDGTLGTLAQGLAAGQITRFAIANPDHAPYGMRAREALITRGLWDAVQPFLVLGENVSQAAQFALSGNADGGIVAHALALAPEVAPLADHALIPQEWHQPLRQRMALLAGAGPVARAFYAYLQQPTARQVFDRYGFALPEGA